MAHRNEGPFTITAGEAFAADRLVRYTGSAWMYCDAGQQPDGVTTEAVASAARVTIHPVNGACIEKLTASKALTVGDQVYPAADGKVSDAVGGGQRLGVAQTATTADGGRVAVLFRTPAGGGGGDAFDWQESVAGRLAFADDEPASPSLGDRYINTGTGTAGETGQTVTANHIYEWNGEQWTDVTLTEGAVLRVEDENVLYFFDGTNWVTNAHIADVAQTQATLTDSSGGSANTTLVDVLAAQTQEDLTDSSGGSANTTLVAVAQQAGGSGVELTDGDPVKINDNFADLAAQLALVKADVGSVISATNDNVADVAAQLAKIKTDVAALVSVVNSMLGQLAAVGIQAAS